MDTVVSKIKNFFKTIYGFFVGIIIGIISILGILTLVRKKSEKNIERTRL